MATQAQVRRIAMALPGTEEIPGRFGFAVRDRDKLKGYAWVWLCLLYTSDAADE